MANGSFDTRPGDAPFAAANPRFVPGFSPLTALNETTMSGTRARSFGGMGIRRLISILDPTTIIAFSVMFALTLCLTQILDDGDTYWQIRTGEWILAHLAIPSIDPFSYTAGTRHWYAHEWLSETLMAIAYRSGGSPNSGIIGVMILAAATTGLTSAIIINHLRRFLPGIYAVVGVVVAFANAAPSFLARPHLLAWPCLALWTGGLVLARANHKPPSPWLLLVMLLWVNLHGSFMIGLLLPFCLLAEALLDPGIDRRQVFMSWFTFSLCSWAVATLNPDGIAGVLFPFNMVRMKSLHWVGEWQPMSFSMLTPVEMIIVASLILGLTGKVRLPPIRLLMFIALIHGTLTHTRNEQLLGIVGVLILAEPLGLCLNRGHATPLRGRWQYLTGGAATLAVVAIAVRLAVPLGPDRTGATMANVLARLPDTLRQKPVLNDYSLGGALIFQGVRPFIDSRADLYGDTFLGRFQQIAALDRQALDSTLNEYHVEWTIFPATSRVVQEMDEEPGWRRLVTDHELVIHVRAAQVSR